MPMQKSIIQIFHLGQELPLSLWLIVFLAAVNEIALASGYAGILHVILFGQKLVVTSDGGKEELVTHPIAGGPFLPKERADLERFKDEKSASADTAKLQIGLAPEKSLDLPLRPASLF